MNQVNKTGTILFGCINREKAGLLDFLGNEDYSVNDDIQQDILNKLVCFSYEEVLKKLEPHIYLALNLDELKAESFTVRSEIDLGRFNECYNISIGTNIDCVLKNGLCNLYTLIDSILCPVSMQEFISDKNALIRSVVCGEEKKAKHLWTELNDKYNSLFLLKYYLNTYNKVLCEYEKEVFSFSDDEKYQIGVIDKSYEDETDCFKVPINKQHVFEQFICEVIESVSGSNIELWKNCLRLGVVCTIDAEDIQQICKTYISYWSEIVKCFWRECQPLIEKLLGIYFFFDKAGKQQTNKWLLVSNEVTDEIIECGNQEKLRKYFEYCNEKKYLGNTICFAILPILGKENKKQSYRIRFKGNENSTTTSINSQENTSEILNILAEYRIQTFLSIEGEVKRDGLFVQENEVENWLGEINKVISQENALFAYPCYPNFVCIPKAHAVYKIDNEFMYLEGISIAASFIAAKIVTDSPINTWFSKKELIPQLNFLAYESKAIEILQNEGYGFLFFPFGKETLVKNTRAASFVWRQEDYFREVFIMTYLERVLRFETDNFKEELLKSFWEKQLNCFYEEEPISKEKGYGVLRRGEAIDYKINNNECHLIFRFNEHKNNEKVRTIKRVENK